MESAYPIVYDVVYGAINVAADLFGDLVYAAKNPTHFAAECVTENVSVNTSGSDDVASKYEPVQWNVKNYTDANQRVELGAMGVHS